ncbi:mechanosensitive ion channel family protein [Sphingobacterium prati]|uniref:mechanosensitive ion channel family protein n=1 Tax=Sphingobacterium prati TaxID=2737006 RepID=UPI00155340B4|nr:mechanosensitive ion channel domain-containing protein [Sphingobacterium prati]NPE48215.1 mechanosensitive ion channel [Sphingobacterium prati]
MLKDISSIICPVLRLSWIFQLSFFFSIVSAQHPDSISRSTDSVSIRDSLPNNPLATTRTYLEQWRTELDQYYTTFDSVKRGVAWQRREANKAAPAQVQSYIHKMKPAVVTLRGKVNVLRKQTVPQDSTASAWKTVQDSVTTLERDIESLLLDMEDLSTKTQQQQKVVQTQQSMVFWYRWKNIIQKNLEQDGLSQRYYDSAWDGRFLLVILGIAYFYWLYQMRKRAIGAGEKLPLHRNQPWWIPILKFAVFFLILLPLTSFRVPVLVLELSYLLIFGFLYLLIRSELSDSKIKMMQFAFFYYIALLIANSVLDNDWITRAAVILVNLAGVRLLWTLGQKTDGEVPFDHLRPLARWGLVVVSILAVIFNVFGFLNLARTCSIAAGVGFLQALSLPAFRNMLSHDLLNSYENAKEGRFINRFDKQKMIAALHRVIGLFATILVIIVWANTLHITSEVRRLFDRLLHSNHTIGSITYSYGDVLLALVVVWTANWIQKNLKDLLDQPEAKANQRRTALLPLVRVFIFIVGFLIGIRILGLGVDKLTVILGALSVGIGLGLQNIINNFVSGVILVFERPFKVGDYVELADKKGQVMQVGIRSSTLLTDQGSQVIIPNGDLLSGRLVNWTFEESDIRLNLQLTIVTGRDIAEWKKWLADTIVDFQEIDRNLPIKVLTKDITADAYVVSIQVGIQNVQQIERFRSKFLEAVKVQAMLHDSKVTSA